MQLRHKLGEKRVERPNRQDKMTLFHDNAKQYVAKFVRHAEGFQMGLSHQIITFFDHCRSRVTLQKSTRAQKND